MDILNSDNDENSDQEDIHGTCGLINIGNTCYMNAVIQTLSNCKPFREWLLSNEFTALLNHIINDTNYTNLNNKYNNFLCFQLRKIFSNIWQNSLFSFRPISFTTLFKKKYYYFKIQINKTVKKLCYVY